MVAQSPASRADAENQLSDALKSLFAVAEAYPELKANGSFVESQEELANTEDRAAYARQYYNDAVLAYNSAIAAFPPSIVAGMFGLRTREYFQTAEEEPGPDRRRPTTVA
jgi:LemA protein